VAAAAEARREDSISTRTLAYVGLGVGVVGLGAFTVFGLMNNSKFDDIE
jgi:hypothetical protein